MLSQCSEQPEYPENAERGAKEFPLNRTTHLVTWTGCSCGVKMAGKVVGDKATRNQRLYTEKLWGKQSKFETEHNGEWILGKREKSPTV